MKGIRLLPARVWIAAGGLFFTAITGWLKFSQSLANYGWYESLGVQPGTWYLIMNGLLTGLVYTLAGIFVFLPLKRVKKQITAFLLVGLAIYWIDRILLARSIEAQSALMYFLVSSAGLTFLAYCLIFWETIKTRIRNG